MKERPGLVVHTATSFWKDYNEIIKDEEEASLILSYLRKNSIVHITRDGDTYVVKVGAEENGNFFFLLTGYQDSINTTAWRRT